MKIIENDIEYDEIADAYKIRASREEYERESALLLKKINDRDEMAKLLKIAKPEKIAPIRELLAQFNEYLEAQEVVTELSYRVFQKRLEMWRRDVRVLAIGDLIPLEQLNFQ